jgi:hypothetical protein
VTDHASAWETKFCFTGSEEKITSARSHLFVPPITPRKTWWDQESSPVVPKSRQELVKAGASATTTDPRPAEPGIYGGCAGIAGGSGIKPGNLRREAGDHKEEGRRAEDGGERGSVLARCIKGKVAAGRDGGR